MSDALDWNSKIIEEFRANQGKVGGQFKSAPIALLHTTGAKTGAEARRPDDVPRRRGTPIRLCIQGRSGHESQLVPATT